MKMSGTEVPSRLGPRLTLCGCGPHEMPTRDPACPLVWLLNYCWSLESNGSTSYIMSLVTRRRAFIPAGGVLAHALHLRVSHHRSSTMRPCYARATSVASGSCPTMNRIQGRMSCSSVVVRPVTCVPGDDINLITDSGRRLLRSTSARTRSSHEHTTVSVTGACDAGPRVWNSLPSYRPTCVRTAAATNSLSDFWKHFYLGVSWPRIVTILLTN